MIDGLCHIYIYSLSEENCSNGADLRSNGSSFFFLTCYFVLILRVCAANSVIKCGKQSYKSLAAKDMLQFDHRVETESNNLMHYM